MQAQKSNAGTKKWCRHKKVMQAQKSDAGTKKWCRHKNVMQAQYKSDAGTKEVMQAQKKWCRDILTLERDMSGI